MSDLINQLIQWVEQRWRSAGPVQRGLYVLFLIVVVVGLAFVVPAIPGFEWLKDLFAKAPPQVQTAVLSVLAVLAVLAAAWGLLRNSRVAEVKEKNAILEARLKAAEEEIKQNQERMDHLLDVEAKAGLWQRPCQVAAPQFVPAHQRKTRFLTVLNLKGGVGKTTLTANLAAGLGLGPKPLRVLLIDIDFQGTLGNAVVEQSEIEKQKKFTYFVNRLLTATEPDDELIRLLKVPMHNIGGVSVILATDTLDTDEFHLQARFFVDGTTEPRFQFVRHLHRPVVFNAFDLVIFDCPPRVTTSVVNAMLCSDFVLIPTRLDRGSIDAVPRTLDWMKKFGPLCPASVVGVVASHVVLRSGRPTKADAQSFELLKTAVESQYGEGLVLKAIVPASTSAVSHDPGVVASVGREGRAVFEPVVAELRARMKI